jgi:protein NrfC
MAEEAPKKENQAKAASKRLPRSQGYLVYDSKKCSGCCSCMLACSLVHEGESNLNLSRIQIVQDPLLGFPEDIDINICRQCVYPVCVEACPTGACHVDTEHGNVRLIDETRCLGSKCRQCFNACPFRPSRVIWNFEKNVATKCDLCLNTPFWKTKGGPGGTQACVQACAFKALKFVDKTPEQRGNVGYDVNLRTEIWGKLGLYMD